MLALAEYETMETFEPVLRSTRNMIASNAALMSMQVWKPDLSHLVDELLSMTSTTLIGWPDNEPLHASKPAPSQSAVKCRSGMQRSAAQFWKASCPMSMTSVKSKFKPGFARAALP